MSNAFKIEALKKAPAKKYSIGDGIILEKTENQEIILHNEGMQYKTVKIYDSANENILGTIELQNNPDYSVRVNLRKNSDTAVLPEKKNSAILYKQPNADFKGSFIVRPSMAHYIRENIKEWKENLSTKIEPAVLNELEEQAKAHLEKNKVSSATFDYEVSPGNKVRLTFTVEKSEDLKQTVTNIQANRLNKTQDFSDKQKSLIAKYNQMVEAEKEGKVVALTVSLGDRDLRHTFWNTKSELGQVEHIEMQKCFQNSTKTTQSSVAKEEEMGDLNDIIA